MKGFTVRDLMRELIEYPPDTEVMLLDERKEDYFDIKVIYDRFTPNKPNRDDAIFLTFNLKEVE